jgi:DNA-directed RNA polymerase specialized sigma subunit, sigma24 homolog
VDSFGNLNKLNEKEKKIFEMLGQGYKIKEIAEILRIKENTIKSIIRRGTVEIKNLIIYVMLNLFQHLV